MTQTSDFFNKAPHRYVPDFCPHCDKPDTFALAEPDTHPRPAIHGALGDWFRCAYCKALIGFSRELGIDPGYRKDRRRLSVTHGEMCRNPDACCGTGTCPMDPACNE